MEALKIPETSRFLLEIWFAIEITLTLDLFHAFVVAFSQKWAQLPTLGYPIIPLVDVKIKSFFQIFLVFSLFIPVVSAVFTPGFSPVFVEICCFRALFSFFSLVFSPKNYFHLFPRFFVTF